MEKIRLGKTELYVSPICYGTWEIGGMPFFQTPDRDVSIRAIHAALDVGINFIDTAPVYGFGRSEELLGQALFGREVVVATKCGLYWTSNDIDSIDVNNSPQFIRNDLEGSLKRLKREHIDLYQVHWPEFVKRTPLEDTINVLEQLKHEGKIRYYGVSNFSADQLKEAMLYGDISTLQNRYSVLMGHPEEITLCQNTGTAFMAYSPLHRGLLTDRFLNDFSESQDQVVRRISEEQDYEANRRKAEELSEIAKSHGVSLPNLVLSYMVNHTSVNIAIVGSKNIAHIADLEKAFDTKVEPDEIRRIL